MQSVQFNVMLPEAFVRAVREEAARRGCFPAKVIQEALAASGIGSFSAPEAPAPKPAPNGAPPHAARVKPFPTAAPWTPPPSDPFSEFL